MLHLYAIAYLCLHFQVADCTVPGVNQSPAYLSVTEGKTANFSCVYFVNKSEDCTIHWYHKPPNQVNLTCIVFSGKATGNTSNPLIIITDKEQNTNWLLIQNLRREDSGTYYCELQMLTSAFDQQFRGNGSRLEVTVPESRKQQKSSCLWLLGCIPMVSLLFLLVIYCYCKTKHSGNPLTRRTPSSNENLPRDASSPDRPIYASLAIKETRGTHQPMSDLEAPWFEAQSAMKKCIPSVTTVEYSDLRIYPAQPETQCCLERETIYSKLQF